MLRRAPFALPRGEHAPDLAAAITGGEAEPRDPPGFVEAAIAHRVLGAGVAALDEGRLKLPPGAARTLRDAHAVGALKAALLRRELAPVTQALARGCGERPIVLKGPALADRFYPDRALRGFADLDLLVPRERLAGAVTALEELGYEERVELRPGFGATHGHDVHMSREVGRHRADVELHWRVGDDQLGVALGHRELAAAAVAAGTVESARYPCGPDQLLVCSMHLLSDRLKRLCWIEDLRRISLSLEDAAWNEAFVRARSRNLLWVLNRALDYCAHHLGARRSRPLGPGSPPPWGPLRAVEELDIGASVHVGRLLALPWRRRARYLRDVLIPSRAGLRGTVGGDDAGEPRLVARHLARVAGGLRRRR